MNQKRVIVNVHIEKTAGTSLLKFFEHTVGKERIAFYDPITDSLTKVSDLPLSPANDLVDKFQLKSYAFWPVFKKTYYDLIARRNQVNVAKNNIAIIHGHFTADRFDKLFPNLLLSVVIRDPFARMHSQYDHWKRAKGRSQWRVMVPYDDSLTFEDFAMLPMMRNYQIGALAGKELASFDLVGVTEKLDAYTVALYNLLRSEGFIIADMPLKTVENLNQKRQNHEIKRSGFEKDFAVFHKEDYALYEQAKSLAK